jgi:3-hydroxyisobutyrate dehydrogenase-like beta-hydroxyacid dehydrogenase
MLQLSELKIAIIGLGYVGLPLAVEFGKKVPGAFRGGAEQGTERAWRPVF